MSCIGYSDGIIEVTTTGGTGPYAYNWSGPSGYSSSNEDIIDLVAGTYNLSVTDAQNCTSNETVTLDEPAPLVLILENHSDISCHYENDGFIETSCWGSVSQIAHTNTTGMDRLLFCQPSRHLQPIRRWFVHPYCYRRQRLYCYSRIRYV